MPTVNLVDGNDPNHIIQKVFADIKATKSIDRIPNIWRALASHPQHLELCWTRLKAIMSPAKRDANRVLPAHGYTVTGSASGLRPKV